MCRPDTLKWLYNLLSPQEQQQNASFGHKTLRDRHTFCRGVLRWHLADILGANASSLALENSANGKPLLAEASQNVFFNYSHSGDYAAFGFTVACDLGVDIEHTQRHRNFAGIAKSFFTDAEARELLTLEGAQQKQRFYEYWTLKEAYLKARGEGIFAGLNTFGFNFPAGRGCAITLLAQEPCSNTDWYFFSTCPLPDYQLALAARSASPLKVTVKKPEPDDLNTIHSA